MAIFFGYQNSAQQWLMQGGWSVSHGSMEGAAWVLDARSREGGGVRVGQYRGRNDELFIRATIVFDEKWHAAIERIPDKERIDLVWNLRLELLKTGLGFSGVDIPLRQVEINERVFAPFSRPVFMQRVAAVVRGVLLVQWTLARRLAQQPPRAQIGFQVPATDEAEDERPT